MKKADILEELQDRILLAHTAGRSSIHENTLLEAEAFNKLKDGITAGIKKIKQFVQDYALYIFLVLAITGYILYGEKVLNLIKKAKGDPESLKKDISSLATKENVDIETATKRKLDLPKVYKTVNDSLVDNFISKAQITGFNLDDLKSLGLDSIISVENMEDSPNEVKVTYRSYRTDKKADLVAKGRKVFNQEFLEAVAKHLKEKNAGTAMLSPKRRVLLHANDMNPITKNLDRSYKLVTAATRRFAKMAALNTKEKETLSAKVIQQFNYILQQEGLINNTVPGKPVEDLEHAISGIKKDIINVKTKKFAYGDDDED